MNAHLAVVYLLASMRMLVVARVFSNGPAGAARNSLPARARRLSGRVLAAAAVLSRPMPALRRAA
jgi:hypothetical protein